MEELSETSEVVLIWMSQDEHVQVILRTSGPYVGCEIRSVLIIRILTLAYPIVDIRHHCTIMGLEQDRVAIAGGEEGDLVGHGA